MRQDGGTDLPAELTPEGAPGWPVEPGQYCYLAKSGEWSFTTADQVFDTPADKHFHVAVYGPYSSVALAEQALDKRIDGSLARGLATVTEQMQPWGQGLRGPHGGTVNWKRDLVWHDHTGEFGDQAGWQEISLVYVDEMP